MKNSGRIIWLTGLSGSGKSTLASLLQISFLAANNECLLLDGDEVRKNLSKGLGFSKEDRDENVRRIGYVANQVASCGKDVIIAAISPYRETRNELKLKYNNFIEVYIKANLATCKARDPKGLYKKVQLGEIKNFTGIDDPYEEPTEPDILIETEKMNVVNSFIKLCDGISSVSMLIDTAKKCVNNIMFNK
ncbi:MAG: adenylyl-sulfate kinase [Thioploca sp.]|nr:adenylyl-sulfate kinase [Thioploca sp.]